MCLRLCVALLLVASSEQSFRSMYLYPVRNLRPQFYECREVTFASEGVTFAAIHIVDNATFDNPCFCDIFVLGSERVSGVNIKVQQSADDDNDWLTHANLSANDWAPLGYRGLKIEARADSVNFYTVNGVYDVSIPISIEVEGKRCYMHSNIKTVN